MKRRREHQECRGQRVVLCRYCGKPAELVPSEAIYPRSNWGWFWLCRPCDAYVGCHRQEGNGTRPLGELANRETREARKLAHAAFDPLWRAKQHPAKGKKRDARKAAYAWLAGEMGVEVVKCHIGLFDAEQCRRVVAICERVYESAKARRDGQ